VTGYRFDFSKAKTPSYLRFAIPGVSLLVFAALIWGRSWWPHAVMIVGLALIIWPLQSPRTGNRSETKKPPVQN
jgi:hypothetical protein